MSFRRLAACALALGVAVLSGGCANLYHMKPTDTVLAERILGRWCNDDIATGEERPSISHELVFNPDGTFTCTQVCVDRPVERHLAGAGSWVVSDGWLIQTWKRRSARHTTVVEFVEARRRQLVLHDIRGFNSSYYRQPRIAGIE
jgi:hypothetical protein